MSLHSQLVALVAATAAAPPLAASEARACVDATRELLALLTSAITAESTLLELPREVLVRALAMARAFRPDISFGPAQHYSPQRQNRRTPAGRKTVGLSPQPFLRTRLFPGSN